MLEVLTIAPPPPRRMSAASAVMAVQCARKFTANCSSTSSSLVVSSGPGRWIAAPLLNAPSRRPCSCSTRSTAARMLARSARSTVTASATPPSARIPATIRWRASVLRAASTTAAPSEAKSRAAAAPMPRLAPVMNTILPVSRPMGVLSLSFVMTTACAGPPIGYRHKRYQGRPPRGVQTGGMDKQELGAFLRSRRERLRPQDVGLPAGPRRRTPGLRREEVAVLAHISTEYYVRLEQGRAPRPSGEVLAGIAGALRLTDAESDHLHVLAGTAPSRTGLHRRDVRPSILALLERLPQTAGFVTSAAFEVLAWNDLAAALMEDFAALTPQDRNLARRAFLGPAHPGGNLYGISDAAEFRHHVVMELRATVARYPTDPAVTDLVAELRNGSAEFARLWDQHDVHAAPMLTKTFRHPAVGEITVDCDSLALADRDQHLVLYTAPPKSRDAQALALLNVL